jgi:hypothetical protein
MKQRALLTALLAPMVLLSGCDSIFGMDNYDPPNAVLSGRLVYQGQPVINLRSGGVDLQLWEPGNALREPMTVHVAQDGTFSAAIFNGTYRLNRRDNTGPWVNSSDTITVNVSGQTTLDIEVVPYYLVVNPQITYSATGGPGGTVTAAFNIGTVNTGRALEFVALYVGKTTFVDPQNREAGFLQRNRAQIANLADRQTLSVVLPANIHVTPSPARRDFVYARIGIKVVGLTELIYSPLFKVAI